MTRAGDHTGGTVRRRFASLPWLALCAVVLAACDSLSGPAPVIDRSYGERQMRSAGEPGVHVVRRGETVYGIAQRYAVSTRALIERNNLRPPYLLVTGSRMQLPTAQVHIVKRGDTLYAISRRYAVDMTTLARTNRLRSPYMIQVGQRLALPLDARPPAAPATQVARAEPRRTPQSPATHAPRAVARPSTA